MRITRMIILITTATLMSIMTTITRTLTRHRPRIFR